MSGSVGGLEQFERRSAGLLVRAPAKLNLSLLVAGKRPDGYHELETVMAKVDWMDELLLEPHRGEGLELICKGSSAVPEGPDNLVWKAWQLVCESVGKALPVRITLWKNIPAGTGLGSGSSDAAATLLGLNRLFNLKLSEKSIFDMACRLGSDVAFFLNGPTAYCTGRGEKIQKILDFPDFRALLIVPIVSVSTKKVYENYVHQPALFESLREQINDALLKKSIDSLAEICANMLQISCFHLHSELADLKAKVERLCAGKVCLSGSGSAMFMLFGKDSNAKIQTCRQLLDRTLGIPCRIVNNNRW